MKIENCKLKIAWVVRAAAQTFNFQFSNFNFQCLFALSTLLALGAYLGLTPCRANETRPPLFEQAKDRTGRGGFPHDETEHIRLQCADCHLAAKEKPVNTDQPTAKDFPHAACIRCHNFAAELFKAAFDQPIHFCGVCHETKRISKSNKALRMGAFPRPGIRDFEDKFSHKAHRRVLPADFQVVPVANPPYGSQFRPGESPRCTSCHEQLRKPEPDVKDMKTEEGHPACFVCHGGAPPEPRRVSAETFPFENDCKACHELRAPDTASLAHGLFGSIKGFRHGDHDIDIRPKRRGDFPLSTAPDRLCIECHKTAVQVETLDMRLPEAGYCDQCHISNKPGLPGKLNNDILNKLRGD